MYSLLYFQADSHFIVSSSYFLLLSRSLCNISLSSVRFATFSCPGSLANGLNKSRKPVPSFLPFPFYTEWSPPIPGKALQPWHRDRFSPPAAEIPLPVPALTGFVICP